jgi:hypothetical protein
MGLFQFSMKTRNLGLSRELTLNDGDEKSKGISYYVLKFKPINSHFKPCAIT